jgi:hypothetical protein
MAWTITGSIDEIYGVCHVMGSEMVIVKLDCVSDASGTDTDLSTLLTGMEWQSILGGWLYGIQTVPGTGGDQPTAAFNLDIQDGQDFSWVDEDSVSHTAVDWISAADEADGQYPLVQKDTAFVCSTLGNENTAVFYLWVLRG